MQEIWKDIAGYKGYYQASNLGKIKSLERYVNTRNNSKRKVSERILKQILSKYGYFSVGLCKNGIMVKRVNRLVAKTFIPNPENKPMTNHKNGIKTDNRVENLEWCTSSENLLHASKNSLNNGTRHWSSKLTKEQVLEIREKYLPYKHTLKMLSKEYEISTRNIFAIAKSKYYKYI